MKTLSEQIRECKDGAAANPYQGNDKKVLFVCSMGILRSATAARLYGGRYNTRSAGTYPDALIPLSPILISWADQIVFVNKANYQSAMKMFEWNDELIKKSITLDIPDTFPHMHPELVQSFKTQYEDC